MLTIRFVLVFFSALTAVLAGDGNCGASSLTGSFGFHLTGTNLHHNWLYAIVGRFEADGQGKLRGTATHSAQGNVSRTTFSGKYTVNADCTGTAVLTFQNEIVSNLDFVISGDLNDVYFIDFDSGVVESGTARRQFSHP